MIKQVETFNQFRLKIIILWNQKGTKHSSNTSSKQSHLPKRLRELVLLSKQPGICRRLELAWKLFSWTLLDIPNIRVLKMLSWIVLWIFYLLEFITVSALPLIWGKIGFLHFYLIFFILSPITLQTPKFIKSICLKPLQQLLFSELVTSLQ